MAEERTILTVHAHPDDEASKGAPTLAMYHAQGVRTVLVCCTGARFSLAYVERVASVGVPFGVYAIAGDPADGLGWNASGAAERYAELARHWRAAGATILGSCCGTSPAHIAALALELGCGSRV